MRGLVISFSSFVFFSVSIFVNLKIRKKIVNFRHLKFVKIEFSINVFKRCKWLTLTLSIFLSSLDLMIKTTQVQNQDTKAASRLPQGKSLSRDSTSWFVCLQYMGVVVRWHSGKVLDLRTIGRGFESQPPRY